MKTDIKDMVFIIPVRLDSIIRLENLILSVQFLLKHFDTNIMILEAASYPNGIIRKILGNKVQYLFWEDKDSVFYKTKYLNIMTLRTCASYIGIWDADIIIPSKQITDSIEKLRQGFHVAYPCDGHCYDTSFVIRELYSQNKNIQFLLKNKEKMSLIYGNHVKGGAVFVNREAFVKAGMMNEKFYGWGPEDFELYERMKNLGFKIHRSEGPMFHLTHNRGNNSFFRSPEQVKNTHKERLITRFSSKAELENEIAKGIFRKVALHTELEGTASTPILNDLVEKEGTAATVLRPSGKVTIDGEMYDGVSESGFIEKGSHVKVVRYENAQVYVETI